MESGIQTIFFDLDGTLVDLDSSYYHLYSRLITEGGGTPLSHGIFWNLKRHHVTVEDLLQQSFYKKSERYFQHEWIESLEKRSFLAQQCLKKGVKETLQRWHQIVPSFILVTGRHKPRNVYWQVRKLGIIAYFQDIIVCKSWAIDAKYEAIRSLSYKKSCIIGDGEADMEAGRRLHIPRIAITTGMRDKTLLSADLYIDNISSLDLSKLASLM